jgi:hypothetical protein
LANNHKEAAMSDEQPTNEKIEVEGHGYRGGAPADEVEGHPFYRGRGDDAEAPESTDLEEAGTDDAQAGAGDDPDVEGHPFAKR